MDKKRDLRFITELRERVNDLMAATQLLTPLVREKGDDRDREHLLILNQSLYRLIRTIRHVDLSQETDLSPELRLIDAAGLCRELGREVADLLALADVDFTWTLDMESLLTLADDALLEQALLNLITNAAEYAGPKGTVELRFSTQGDRAMFIVRDSGPGLQSPDPEAEADPFLKTPGGMGLGLNDARRIAQLHEGRLMLDSRPGEGVQAVLSIPIRKGDASTVEAPFHFQRSHWGGFSPVLVELSPVLPPQAFAPEDIE